MPTLNYLYLDFWKGEKRIGAREFQMASQHFTICDLEKFQDWCWYVMANTMWRTHLTLPRGWKSSLESRPQQFASAPPSASGENRSQSRKLILSRLWWPEAGVGGDGHWMIHSALSMIFLVKSISRKFSWKWISRKFWAVCKCCVITPFINGSYFLSLIQNFECRIHVAVSIALVHSN